MVHFAVVFAAFCILSPSLAAADCASGPRNDLRLKKDQEAHCFWRIITSNVPGQRCFRAVVIASDDNHCNAILSNGTVGQYIANVVSDGNGHFKTMVDGKGLEWTTYKIEDDNDITYCSYVCSEKNENEADQFFCYCPEKGNQEWCHQQSEEIREKITDAGIKITGTYDRDVYPETCNRN